MQNNRGRYNEDRENISCFFACVHKSVSFQTDLFVPSFQDWRSNYSRSSPSNLPVCAASNSWPFSKKAPGERNLGDATRRDAAQYLSLPCNYQPPRAETKYGMVFCRLVNVALCDKASALQSALRFMFTSLYRVLCKPVEWDLTTLLCLLTKYCSICNHLQKSRNINKILQ